MFLIDSEVCPVCGKEFFPNKWEWVYRRGEVLFCSWKCLRRATKDEKKQELTYDGAPVIKLKNSGPKKKLQQLDMDGNVVHSYKCAVHVMYRYPDFKEDGVRIACRTGKLYKGYYWRYE